MKNYFLKKAEGFTLIEVMISIGLFSVIMVVGITAILSVNNTYRKTRTMRSAIDNLSFIMEDMTRNIRLGSRYRCLTTRPSGTPTTEIEQPKDGAGCLGIAFEPFWDQPTDDPGDQVIYFIEDQSIFKSMDGGENFEPMNSIDVKIYQNTSGFNVYASSPDSNDQPSVLIILGGEVEVGANVTTFDLQTTVSQRLLNISSPENPTGGDTGGE